MATWYILSDIPYQKEFPEMPSAPIAPERPYDWYILNAIPYRKEFPEMPEAPVAPPIAYDWYILNDIPYRKEFPELLKLAQKPEYPKTWCILEDIPYIKTYVTVLGLSAKPDYPRIWYILENIPYIKDYPQVLGLSAKPDYPRIWYILEDIPYIKDYPAVLGLSTKPNYPRIWWIDTDIPYIKEYPDVIPLSRKPDYPRIWYILEDIPYLKEYPPMYYMEPQPVPIDWYILYDIPYRKEYPPMCELDPIPIPIPDELQYYVVGIAAIGRWQIRKCTEYDTENWTLIEDIGPPTAVKAAYIEADGNFDYIAGNDSITLITTDTPWMAVITTTKKLYVKQVCADIETAILLDTGVEQASLCRGWKSDKYSVDSGLICAYRKSDGVYAKVYKKIDGEYVWETLPQLLYEPVDHVEVKRMNDYRIGVYVTNPNRLLLSERFYIGGTSKTEYISVKLKPWANVCSFSMVGEPAEKTFKVERCWMEEDTKVRMHCNYPIVSFDPDYPNITLTDDYNYSKLVEYYIQNGDLVCILDKPKYSSYNTIRIVIPSINHILYQITPQFKRTIPGGEYAVENPPIAEHIDVRLTVTPGVLAMTEKQHYRVTYDVDHMNVGLSVTAGVLNMTSVETKSGTYENDQVAVALATSVGVLTMTQEGDLPI